jgi:methylenetetrahydrofolate dehydrogenase (NADP+)/methenyltetrahydrofolate cyclohydrolase
MLSLDGRIARDFYKGKLVKKVDALARKPLLAIVQVGDDPSSAVYIEQKKKFGASIGALVEHVRIDVEASQGDVAEAIARLNARTDVDGIILQLPLPPQLEKIALINLIDPQKDVDGLTDECQCRLAEGRPLFVPATAKGVMALLDFYKVTVAGKKAAVMGRSRLVGSPVAALLRASGADVAVCHSQTPDAAAVTRGADMLVVAIGRPALVGAAHIKPGAVVVDVGLTKRDGKLWGDVDHAAVAGLVSALTPVPGGVGPMTVLSLFDNLVTSAEYSQRSRR